MKYMFQNEGQKAQLITYQDLNSICIEIRTIDNSNDFKMFPLNDIELVELRDLLTSFIDSKRHFAPQSDIQEAELVG